jgi:uracil-DNA glycosylase
MSPEPTTHNSHDLNRRRAIRALPWLWVSLSAFWAIVILVTGQLAWPLALWTATTLGPLSMVQTRLKSE